MTQTYTKPTLTSDVVAIRFHHGYLQVFLVDDRDGVDAVAGRLPSCPVEANQSPVTCAQSMMRALGADRAWLEAGTFTATADAVHSSALSIALVCLTTTLEDGDCEAQGSVPGTWHELTKMPRLNARDQMIIDAGLQTLRRHALTDTLPLLLLPRKFRMRTVRHLYSQILGTAIKPSQLKSWMRKRQAVRRVGPARFERNPQLVHDFLCPPFTQSTDL
ncbi:MAG: hypothetical protein ACON3Z_05755 [Bradymonadia bacterium]